MKILTVNQPWALAIVEGIKLIENRARPTKHRGAILIHAGKSRRWVGTDLLPEAQDEPALTFGAIIGGVEIIDCVPVELIDGQRFAWGPWCWILANPWKLIHPVPLRGQLGLFTADSSTLAACASAGPQ